ADTPKANIILAGATGVPQAFYRRFAEYAATYGYTVITFDYRGIGRSKPADFNNFDSNFIEWATLDLAAVVDTVTDDLPLFMVGHSFGGHAFGLLPNHQKIQRLYTFATGAGWYGYMPKAEAVKVKLLWDLILPALAQWKGYIPMSLLNMGEDLPYGVYQQWKRWCKFPHYFFDDPKVPEIAEQFAKIRTPIIAANALDDLWALPQSRNAFMQGYKNADVELIDIALTQALPKIGHMGYFRSEAKPLWDNVLTAFNQTL
ncbi:MAG: alpha/beta fold hydrolase, partial [Acinetobacter sp.]